jgi:hypothetical protein
MDIKEAPAMTQASGLTNEQDVNEHTFDPRQRFHRLRRMPRSAGPSGCAR